MVVQSRKRKPNAGAVESPAPEARRKSGRVTKVEEKKATRVDDGGNGSDDELLIHYRKKNKKPISQTNDDEPSGVVVKSDEAMVRDTIRLFNKHYLHFVQTEKERCDSSKTKGKKKKQTAKRPDLKTANKMKENKETLNCTKIIGDIPGIKVGHQFFCRTEMVVVGLHSHWINGIDYMGKNYSKGKYKGVYKFPLAVSVVMSGMYEDDLDNSEDIVYTGQGGNNLNGDQHQIEDQVMKRGNLALKNCVEQNVPVRVIRGHKAKNKNSCKLFTYDGLYKVNSYWAEKGNSGFTVFKYSLKRLEGQPLLTTDRVRFIYGKFSPTISEIRGLVCEDISGGQERFPIVVSNTVDEAPVVPAGFQYSKSIQIAPNVQLPSDCEGCACKGNCDFSKTCSCTKLNGSFPYVLKSEIRLIEPKDVVYECGPKCGCGPECYNRASQNGVNHRLEIFRTQNKGWGVRSWDDIRAGAPVCEYVGYIRKNDANTPSNDYIFDIDCEQTINNLDGRMRRSLDESVPIFSSPKETIEREAEYCIDPEKIGNIARFINHSCEPNLFVQCVLSSHHNKKLARIVLYAFDNIPPLKELTYDYGYIIGSVVGVDGIVKEIECFCGSADCRKRLL